ncbi:hypothetical protein [Tropicimonas sediminicola]|uniref:hypothetical protein n=1 Tax=Tropicimonas sediminicola TaxID=1031541 RepID=UPI001FE84EDF|nr:hypothetical protein [Tropicimonas sediminicola]
MVSPAYAASDEAPAGLSIELSSAEELPGTCRMSFLIRNGSALDIDQAVYETVLFSREGQVALMTLLDLKDLPAGRPRVRQFQFDGLECAEIGSVLINGAHACEGEGLAVGACIDGLELTTRTDVELLG